MGLEGSRLVTHCTPSALSWVAFSSCPPSLHPASVEPLLRCRPPLNYFRTHVAFIVMKRTWILFALVQAAVMGKIHNEEKGGRDGGEP